MKICYFVTSLRSSGPTNQLLYLLEENSNKADCELIYLSSNNISEFHFNEIQNLNIKITQLSFFKALKFLNTNRFDIIHSQGLLTDLISTFQLKSKSILTSRNNPFKDYPAKFGFTKGIIMALTHWLIQFLNCNVVACSFALGNDLKKIGINNCTIQNGTRVPSLNSEKFKLISNVKGISTGNLIPRKNYEYMFKLLSFLPSKNLDIYGASNNNVKKYPSNVTLKGYNNKVINLYSNYDYFISTSLSEGLPNSVLEAAMFGLPLILSNITPHIEIIDVLPNCLLIDLNKDAKYNSSLISDYLKSIEVKNRKEIALKAKHFFSKEKMAENYYKLYESKL